MPSVIHKIEGMPRHLESQIRMGHAALQLHLPGVWTKLTADCLGLEPRTLYTSEA